MALELLQTTDFLVFTTRGYALAARMSVSAATRQLGRLARKRIVTKVTRGMWANTRHPYFTPLSVVPVLLQSEQGYVSFLTALHDHGVISQIPQVYHVATTGQSRTLQSPIGTFAFLQLQPTLMTQGVRWSDTHAPYRIATAERALLDTLYISTRKGRRFASLPELTLPEAFSKKHFLQLLQATIYDKRIQGAIVRRASSLGLT